MTIRVLLSLTPAEVTELISAVQDGCGPQINTNAAFRGYAWNQRLLRISDHLNDEVDIHFTDLGTED
jgi:hypothetical protein